MDYGHSKTKYGLYSFSEEPGILTRTKKEKLEMVEK